MVFAGIHQTQIQPHQFMKIYTPVGPKEDSFDKIIKRHAAMHGVPAALIKGFCAAESWFNPNAKRDEPQIKDASRGLMQILYRTAKGVGFAGQPDDLFDPETNIHWATKFLKSLIDRPGYSLPDAVAAYNMGHPRPASKTTGWIIKIHGKPLPDWHYANEPYVRKIFTYAAFYRAKEEGNLDAAKKILVILKKKIRPCIQSILSWTQESTKDQPSLTCISFDFHRLSEVD